MLLTNSEKNHLGSLYLELKIKNYQQGRQLWAATLKRKGMMPAACVPSA